jgi:hypothetical protein
MLQRSQTLLLLAAFVLAILMLTGPLARFVHAGGEMLLKHSGLFDQAGEKVALATWPLSVAFIVVAVLSFLTIFSYMNRMRQMRLCVFLIIVHAGIVGLMFYYTWVAGRSVDTEQTLHLWRFAVPPINMILYYLAFRRIRRDELLVKAYDRIR